MATIMKKEKIELSNREKEFIMLLSEGKTIKEIASLLRISLATAESLKHSLMVKLDVSSLEKLREAAEDL